MSSVQEREQSGDAASESGFFEKGHARGALAEGRVGGGLQAGPPQPAEPDMAPPHSAEAGAVPAIEPEGSLESDRVGEAVLQAFGEVRSLNVELQRANDALHFVNETLRDKMDLLRTTALDLEQMLEGVSVGVLLLDEDLTVRHFNDMAAHFLGLSRHDVGGSISASCRGFGPTLVEWCRDVLRSGRRVRRTFQSAIGEPLTLHMRRTRVDGEARLILVFSEMP